MCTQNLLECYSVPVYAIEPITVDRPQWGEVLRRQINLSPSVWYHQPLSSLKAAPRWSLFGNNILHSVILAAVFHGPRYLVRFQVLTATSMNMTLLWNVAPYSLVEVYRRFRSASFIHHQGIHRPDDWGSKYLWNVGKLLPDYTAQQTRR
jgi:hypothetical protein